MVEDNIARDTRSKLPYVFSVVDIVEGKQKGETVSNFIFFSIVLNLGTSDEI